MSFHSQGSPIERFDRVARHGGAMRMRDEVQALAARQDGVVTTAQCRALGVPRSTVRDQVSSRRWQRAHRGVLIAHSGPVPWRTRARAALLYAGQGAALSHESAGFVHTIVPKPPKILDVTIPRERVVRPQPGLRIHRPVVMPTASGRLRTVEREHTALDLVAAARSEDEAIGVLCAAVRARTSRLALLIALEDRPGYKLRELVLELLGQVEEGVESTLEHRYEREVESAHGLPTSVRQRRSTVDGQWVRADCTYEDYRVRVELDGQLAHPGRATDTDLWRDNAVVLELDEITLRYRWRHVASTPCRTAAQVGRALHARGWPGELRRCGPACQI